MPNHRLDASYSQLVPARAGQSWTWCTAPKAVGPCRRARGTDTAEKEEAHERREAGRQIGQSGWGCVPSREAAGSSRMRARCLELKFT